MLSSNQLLRNTGSLFPIQVSFLIAASFGLYLAVLSLSNEEMNNGTSLLISTSGGLIAIYFFYLMLQKYFVMSILKYALIFFLIRLTIVLALFIFLEPDYFRHSSSDFPISKSICGFLIRWICLLQGPQGPQTQIQ